MSEDSEAVRACLVHMASLEARLPYASGGDRERLLAEIAAGEKLIDRLRREAPRRAVIVPFQPRRPPAGRRR